MKDAKKETPQALNCFKQKFLSESPSQEHPMPASTHSFGVLAHTLIGVSMGSGGAVGGNKEMQQDFFLSLFKSCNCRAQWCTAGSVRH